MTLGADPRADRRMIEALATVGMHEETPPSPLGPDSSLEEILAHIAETEAGFAMLFELLNPGPLPPVKGVESRCEVIAGGDGNDLSLYIHRPVETPANAGPLPAVLYFHGGAMAMLNAADLTYVRWRDELAALNLVVIGPEFRNAAGALGPHPFPAGLDDCASALRWVQANKGALGVSKIIVAGESGGGNLALATTLKARRDGCLPMIDGVYAMCPYISGAYGDPPAELESLAENDGYLLSCEMMAPLVECYDPGGANRTNPLAWPYHASVESLKGLPPHVISVNELDPLRDEGLAYYRKLAAAGVPAVGRTVNGTCHAGDLLMPGPMPDVYAASTRDLAGFAHGV